MKGTQTRAAPYTGRRTSCQRGSHARTEDTSSGASKKPGRFIAGVRRDKLRNLLRSTGCRRDTGCRREPLDPGGTPTADGGSHRPSLTCSGICRAALSRQRRAATHLLEELIEPTRDGG